MRLPRPCFFASLRTKKPTSGVAASWWAAAASTAETSGTAPTAMPPTASTQAPAISLASKSSPASFWPSGRINVVRRSR